MSQSKYGQSCYQKWWIAGVQPILTWPSCLISKAAERWFWTRRGAQDWNWMLWNITFLILEPPASPADPSSERAFLQLYTNNFQYFLIVPHGFPTIPHSLGPKGLWVTTVASYWPCIEVPKVVHTQAWQVCLQMGLNDRAEMAQSWGLALQQT